MCVSSICVFDVFDVVFRTVTDQAETCTATSAFHRIVQAFRQQRQVRAVTAARDKCHGPGRLPCPALCPGLYWNPDAN